MKRPIKAKEAFKFYTRFNLRELTGKKAKNLRELVDIIKEVPGSVIYYHTHVFLQQHLYLSPEPPNDFGYWVREILQEYKLGEELSSIDILQFKIKRLKLSSQIVSITELDIASA